MVNTMGFYGQFRDNLVMNDCLTVQNYLIGVKEFIQSWYAKLNIVEAYIIEHDKLPTQNDTPESNRNCKWLLRQQTNYNRRKHSMTDVNIRTTYEEFKLKYSLLFGPYISNDDLWYSKMHSVEDYIIEHGKLPSKSITLGIWVSTQQCTYKTRIYIMKNGAIRDAYDAFRSKYPKLFSSWYYNLNSIEDYIAIYGKLPSESASNTDDESRHLREWLSKQQTHYKTGEQCMKNNDNGIRDMFAAFITKHSKLMIASEQKWYFLRDSVENYINLNGMLPQKRNLDPKTKKLGTWLSTQYKNYRKVTQIMKDPDIRDAYDAFRTKHHRLFEHQEF
jgi:hypothetical protein